MSALFSETLDGKEEVLSSLIDCSSFSSCCCRAKWRQEGSHLHHHQICRAQRQEAPWSAGWMCGVSRHLHLLRVWVDNVLHLTCCRQRQQRDLQREVGWPTAQRGLSLTLTAVTALSHLSLQLKGHAQFLQCDVWCLQIRQNLRWGPTTAHSLPNSNHGRHMTVSESIGGRT